MYAIRYVTSEPEWSASAPTWRVTVRDKTTIKWAKTSRRQGRRPRLWERYEDAAAHLAPLVEAMQAIGMDAGEIVEVTARPSGDETTYGPERAPTPDELQAIQRAWPQCT